MLQRLRISLNKLGIRTPNTASYSLPSDGHHSALPVKVVVSEQLCSRSLHTWSFLESNSFLLFLLSSDRSLIKLSVFEMMGNKVSPSWQRWHFKRLFYTEWIITVFFSSPPQFSSTPLVDKRVYHRNDVLLVNTWGVKNQLRDTWFSFIQESCVCLHTLHHSPAL